PSFPLGVFVAVDNDVKTAVVSWETILNATGLGCGVRTGDEPASTLPGQKVSFGVADPESPNHFCVFVFAQSAPSAPVPRASAGPLPDGVYFSSIISPYLATSRSIGPLDASGAATVVLTIPKLPGLQLAVDGRAVLHVCTAAVAVADADSRRVR